MSDNSAGRTNGASAPYLTAMSAISGESVETRICSNKPLSLAAPIGQASIGRPANSLIFLPGMRLEPPRAGMTAILIIASRPIS